ncbi:F-box domain-containing protein [Apiospora marii]|uniref:F-box domain-containing protein n=1 Tax=Apiospora marii TaxID=335849 RepID=UPI0031309C24
MASSPPPLTLDSLPSEVLIHVLESIPTRKVLPLAGVSRRFHGLVARLHYARLVEALGLQDHEIILECYHPTVKISTPYLFCDYVGTPGLAAESAGVSGGGGKDPSLAGMNALYSRFRPVQQEDDRRPRSRYPKRAVVEGVAQPLVDQRPSHDVHLDAGELFSQLVTVTNLVKVEPKRKLIIDAVNMTDGVIRVWRPWLASEAAAPTPAQGQGQHSARESGSSSVLDDSAILWADSKQNCGLRMRVVEKTDEQAPVLVAADDDPAISYKLEFEGKSIQSAGAQKLLIRTNQLLLNVEKSKGHQVVHTAGSGDQSNLLPHCDPTEVFVVTPCGAVQQQQQQQQHPTSFGNNDQYNDNNAAPLVC